MKHEIVTGVWKRYSYTLPWNDDNLAAIVEQQKQRIYFQFAFDKVIFLEPILVRKTIIERHNCKHMFSTC